MSFHKYHAQKTIIEGKEFPSKLHAATYAELRQEERAGLIRDIELEVRVEPELCPTCGIRPAPSVKVDFRFVVCATGKYEWAEAKGVELPRWKLFLAWWRESGPGRLRIYKRGTNRPKLVEVVNP